MSESSSIRVVVDTNVLFTGLTQQGGAAGLLVDAWLAGVLDVCVSTALAYEYADVLSRKLAGHRWQLLEPVVGTLLSRARFITIYFTWRPASPDPGDEHVIDCAMNANAAVVTFNERDFRTARTALGLTVFTPVELVQWISIISSGKGVA